MLSPLLVVQETPIAHITIYESKGHSRRIIIVPWELRIQQLKDAQISSEKQRFREVLAEQ